MNPICYLCGSEIVNETPSKDHAIPSLFIKRSQPKVKGFDYGGMLPTHSCCNTRFDPETMCSKALQVLGAYTNKIYSNSKDPKISIQTFKKEELSSFSKKDFEFFGLIDTTNLAYEDWAHNPDFFKDKKRNIPLEKPLNIAFSVLTKSAAALLVKRYNVSPKSFWKVFCIPYQTPIPIDFGHIFRNTKLFGIGVEVSINKCENDDYFVAYNPNGKVILIIVFTFSQDEKYLKYCINRFREAEKFLFKRSKLKDLVGFNWFNNKLKA